MALCVQDPPNRNANALLIPATIGSGVHTTKALPWANTHVCLRTCCPWGATSLAVPWCGQTLPSRGDSRMLPQMGVCIPAWILL